MFEYDSQSELDFQEHERYERDRVSICDVSYASPRGGRVSALLLVPQRDDALAGLLFMHPGGASRHAFLDEAIVVSQNGGVALLIDAPHARSPDRSIFSFNDQDHDDFVQAVVDLRRGVDLLVARPQSVFNPSSNAEKQ